MFMGTPAFSIPTLRALHESGETIAAVVTRPDSPQGRGKRVSPPEAKVEALRRGLPVMQPATLKDPRVLADLGTMDPDIIVVAAYGRILPREVLALPPHGCINLHPSLLPRYRGPAPIQRAVLQGEKKTGVTVIRLVEKMDAGPIILQREVPIGEEETAEELGERLSVAGADLVMEAVRAVGAGSATLREQNEAEATLAPLLRKEEGEIDWTGDAAAIRNRVRGLLPWPGAHTTIGGRMIKLYKARAQEPGAGGRPGTITEAGPGGIRVATGKGDLVILELQAEGKKRMSAKEFLLGRSITVGTICGQ